jgi:hypothetical protein
MEKITADRLRELVSYDQTTGNFTWKATRRGCRPGDPVGTVLPTRQTWRSYRQVMLDRRGYLGHRLAWLYMTGEWPAQGMDIDHINGDGLDNRWSNLRLSTRAENIRNSRAPSSNTSGFKGVSRSKRSRRWQAHIKVDGRSKHLGCFDTPEEAHAAYAVAAVDHYGPFARLF